MIQPSDSAGRNPTGDGSVLYRRSVYATGDCTYHVGSDGKKVCPIKSRESIFMSISHEDA